MPERAASEGVPLSEAGNRGGHRGRKPPIVTATFDSKITGGVSNFRREDKVELVCGSLEKKEFKELLKKLKIKLKEDMNLKIKFDPLKDIEQKYKNKKFGVNREDDLREMVWALQGAGYTFQQLMKSQQKTEAQKIDFRIMSIESEIGDVTIYFDEILNTQKISNSPPRHVALDRFLIEPFNRDLLYQLSELSSFLDRIKQDNNAKISKKELVKMRKLCDEIVISLGKMRKRRESTIK